ncbi:MAG: dTDP-4-dehydrorhamnose 3,5-epimerase family protein [Patescibacteria group bacterium]|nr:dTDP-4-dehydrorhamnose 3,5-epimerase family protein [Patescibacteria group bacterium]MDD5121687.1 dTDP-4-dehydrorhamnose 3,5-epimerase family protein [Patescibacteria group bacterium]MDD5396149.1 dTDP-4-dehydrorhamnose 3,5-epimerase family protein [Patescibacteria group bacterium]
MIQGVQLKKINANFDDRGFLCEVFKDSEISPNQIKQTTYTETLPGVIKAFHWHKKQRDYWFVAGGLAQVVLYDLRQDSSTKGQIDVFYLGEKNLALLIIPPGVAHGYRVLGNKPACLFYHTSEVYNPQQPDEERISFDDPQINFNWQTKNR